MRGHMNGVLGEQAKSKAALLKTIGKEVREIPADKVPDDVL